MRRFALGLLVLGCLAGCGEAPTEDEADPTRQAATNKPDIVVILIDTLRPDHLDLYGYERETAPFLTELAAQSTVFRHAWSTSSWTAPATASLFTSTYPTRHGVTRGFFASRDVQQKIADGDATRIAVPQLPANRPRSPRSFATPAIEPSV